MCVRLVTQSCPTLLNPWNCSPPGSSVHGDTPGKNTGVGCRALLQGIFPTQGSNLCLLTSPVLAGRFFTTSTTWEAWDIIISCNRLHGLKKNRNLLYDSSGGYKSQATKSCYKQGHAPLETPGIILPFLTRYCWWAIDA